MKCSHCQAQWNVRPDVSSQMTNCPFCGKSLMEKKQTLDTIEDVLREIIRLEGEEILRNGNRMLSFFADFAPQLTGERRMLRYFVNCGGNTTFLDVRHASQGDQRLKYQQVVYTMCNELFIEKKVVDRICDAVWTALYGESILIVTEEKQSAEQKKEKTQTLNAEELYRQGLAYLEGETYKGQKYLLDYAKAVPLLRQAADLGNVDAQQKIGLLLYNGDKIPCNYSEAAFWFRKAAEQGNVPAQYNLGQCYNFGRGVPTNKAEALAWYCKAAAREYSDAQVKAGSILYNGEGVSQNYQEAAIWFRRAAEQGNMAAQYNLGLCYEHGNGVGQNKAEALAWYRKSAAQGDADAQYKAGSLLYYGDGVATDYKEAVIWLRRAAEQGQKDAQYNLALCYINGHGVEQSKAEALNWCSQSAAQGYEPARRRLKNLN